MDIATFLYPFTAVVTFMKQAFFTIGGIKFSMWDLFIWELIVGIVVAFILKVMRGDF